MSKAGRGRRTTEQQREARQARTTRGNTIRTAWTSLDEIAQRLEKSVGVSQPTTPAKKQ